VSYFVGVKGHAAELGKHRNNKAFADGYTASESNFEHRMQLSMVPAPSLKSMLLPILDRFLFAGHQLVQRGFAPEGGDYLFVKIVSNSRDRRHAAV
jgi:hypothetical protein